MTAERGPLAMNYPISSSIRSSLSIALASGVAALVAFACDLPDKDLGSDPAGSSSDTGGSCAEEAPTDDCNTCACEDGVWVCTAIGCDPTAGATTTSATDGPLDTGGPLDCSDQEDPSDECNACECQDGVFQCLPIDCDTTGGDECDPADDPSSECNACECEGGLWTCTATGVCPSDPVGTCNPATDSLDPLFVTDAAIVGDELHVGVEYSGGCEEHLVGSCWDESFAESEPVQAFVTITHESNDDPCEAIESQMLDFDLTPLRDEWLDAYGGGMGGGTMIINVAGFPGGLEYSF